MDETETKSYLEMAEAEFLRAEIYRDCVSEGIISIDVDRGLMAAQYHMNKALYYLLHGLTEKDALQLNMLYKGISEGAEKMIEALEEHSD